MVTKISIDKYFNLSPPSWNGEPFITSKQFLRTFSVYHQNKNYVKLSDVGPILQDLFSEAKLTIDPHMATTYQRDYIFYLEHKNQKLISMKLLYETLKILDFNFLKRYRGRSKYSLGDILKIWTHYTSNPKTGYMEASDVETFAFDMMTHAFQKYDLHLIKELSENLIYLAGCIEEGRMSFSGFANLLPSDKNLTTTFPERKNISREDFDKGFSYYDQFGSELVRINDLNDLLKDVFQQLGMDDSEETVKANRDALLSVVTPDKEGKIRRSDIALLLSH